MGQTLAGETPKHEEGTETPVDGVAVPRRAPYRAPTLQRHGALWRITEGANSRANFETIYSTTGPVT